MVHLGHSQETAWHQDQDLLFCLWVCCRLCRDTFAVNGQQHVLKSEPLWSKWGIVSAQKPFLLSTQSFSPWPYSLPLFFSSCSFPITGLQWLLILSQQVGKLSHCLLRTVQSSPYSIAFNIVLCSAKISGTRPWHNWVLQGHYQPWPPELWMPWLCKFGHVPLQALVSQRLRPAQNSASSVHTVFDSKGASVASTRHIALRYRKAIESRQVGYKWRLTDTVLCWRFQQSVRRQPHPMLCASPSPCFWWRWQWELEIPCTHDRVIIVQ